MEKTTVNECVAQGAAAWYEKEKHESIMKTLDCVHGYWSDCQCDYGHGSVWRVDALPLETLREIMERGNHEEIMYMIRRYGNAAPPQRFASGCTACHHFPTTDHILPEEIQEMIACRNDASEMELYLSYQGFDKKGQNVVLDRGNHEEIMHYLARHGFQPVQQRRLLERGNNDEIMLHIAKHGLASELLDELFDRIETGGSIREYYDFINLRELPVSHQKRMVRVVGIPEFKAYVDRYGLWEDAHADLVRSRSEDDLLYYIERHRYLCPEAERLLAQRNFHRLNMLYIEKYPGKLNHFWSELMSVIPLDYEALTACFQKLDYSLFSAEFCLIPGSDGENSDIRLMNAGTHEEVINRIKSGKLTARALAYLFFRGHSDEFEAYVNTWVLQKADTGLKDDNGTKKDNTGSSGSFDESSEYHIGEQMTSPIEYAVFL